METKISDTYSNTGMNEIIWQYTAWYISSGSQKYEIVAFVCLKSMKHLLSSNTKILRDLFFYLLSHAIINLVSAWICDMVSTDNVCRDNRKPWDSEDWRVVCSRQVKLHKYRNTSWHSSDLIDPVKSFSFFFFSHMHQINFFNLQHYF